MTNPNLPRSQLVALHIPGSIGTGLRHFLTWLHPELRCFDATAHYPIQRLSFAQLAQYDLLSGPFGFGLVNRLSAPAAMAFLRHPVDSLLSIYQHWRLHLCTPDTIDATERGVAAFLQITTPHLAEVRDNGLTWQFFLDASSRVRAQFSGIKPSALVKRAVANIAGMAFVGFYETFVTDLRRMVTRFDWALPEDVGNLFPIAPKTNLAQNLPSRLRLRLEACVAQDLDVYHAAREIWAQTA